MSKRDHPDDAALPFEIPSSPHFPIGRARAERDAAARWLAQRRKTLHRSIERVTLNPYGRPLARLQEAIRRRRDWRGYAGLLRLVEFARFVLALEQKQSPPPQEFHPVAIDA